MQACLHICSQYARAHFISHICAWQIDTYCKIASCFLYTQSPCPWAWYRALRRLHTTAQRSENMSSFSWMHWEFLLLHSGVLYKCSVAIDPLQRNEHAEGHMQVFQNFSSFIVMATLCSTGKREAPPLLIPVNHENYYLKPNCYLRGVIMRKLCTIQVLVSISSRLPEFELRGEKS